MSSAQFIFDYSKHSICLVSEWGFIYKTTTTRVELEIS